VDYEGLNDKITSTGQTPRRENFRGEIQDRDGLFCVVTRAGKCDAAHIIPRSKGDEVTSNDYDHSIWFLNDGLFQYIFKVVRERWPLYEDEDTPPEIRINAVENGVFLRSDLRKMLGEGDVAFLKV
jgi:hypothetical protein